MRGIVLVDHGSRAESANAQLEALAGQVAAALSDCVVRAAHMELASPSVSAAVDACVESGATDIRVHPFFVAPGRHVRDDIPRLIEEAARKHPDIPIRLTEPLGLHPSVVEAVLARLADADGSAGSAVVESAGVGDEP